MARGFMRKMLWVDLSKKGLKDEALNEKLGRDFFRRLRPRRQNPLQSAGGRSPDDPLGGNSSRGRRVHHKKLRIPVFSIGAGMQCDVQLVIVSDMIG